MGDQRRMAAGDVHAMPLVHVQLGHGLGHRHAHAHALIVGQRDDAADPPAVLPADQRHRAQNATGTPSHRARKQRAYCANAPLK